MPGGWDLGQHSESENRAFLQSYNNSLSPGETPLTSGQIDQLAKLSGEKGEDAVDAYNAQKDSLRGMTFSPDQMNRLFDAGYPQYDRDTERLLKNWGLTPKQIQGLDSRIRAVLADQNYYGLLKKPSTWRKLKHAVEHNNADELRALLNNPKLWKPKNRDRVKKEANFLSKTPKPTTTPTPTPTAPPSTPTNSTPTSPSAPGGSQWVAQVEGGNPKGALGDGTWKTLGTYNSLDDAWAAEQKYYAANPDSLRLTRELQEPATTLSDPTALAANSSNNPAAGSPSSGVATGLAFANRQAQQILPGSKPPAEDSAAALARSSKLATPQPSKASQPANKTGQPGVTAKHQPALKNLAAVPAKGRVSTVPSQRPPTTQAPKSAKPAGSPAAPNALRSAAEGTSQPTPQRLVLVPARLASWQPGPKGTCSSSISCRAAAKAADRIGWEPEEQPAVYAQDWQTCEPNCAAVCHEAAGETWQRAPRRLLLGQPGLASWEFWQNRIVRGPTSQHADGAAAYRLGKSADHLESEWRSAAVRRGFSLCRGNRRLPGIRNRFTTAIRLDGIRAPGLRFGSGILAPIRLAKTSGWGNVVRRSAAAEKKSVLSCHGFIEESHFNNSTGPDMALSVQSAKEPDMTRPDSSPDTRFQQSDGPLDVTVQQLDELVQEFADRLALILATSSLEAAYATVPVSVPRRRDYVGVM